MDNDTIGRQAAIDYFVTNVGFHDEDGYPIEDTDELRKIWTDYFDGIPSAERRGRWDNGFCSVCGAEALTEWNDTGGEYAFTTCCPNCGARMDEEETK